MIFEMRDTAEDLFALRMRTRDEDINIEKLKMLTLDMLTSFARSTEAEDS